MYSLNVSGVLQVTLRDAMFSLMILKVTNRQKQNELKLVKPIPALKNKLRNPE